MDSTRPAPARSRGDDPAPRLAIASVVDQVYSAIRARIMDGTLQRGARIHQEDLADELGVSRTPVREALRRLAAEGLVEMRTNRGARVADVGGDDMHAAYQARLVIEPGAARLAALQAPAEALASGCAPRWPPSAGRSPTCRRSFEANREFHLALVQASGNEFLIQFVQRLWVARIGEVIYERQSETPERMGSTPTSTSRSCGAIESGNGRRAESLTRRHLADAMQRSHDLLS